MPKNPYIAVISNPAAGQRSGPFLWGVINRLKKKGAKVDLIVTEAPGHAVKLAADLSTEGSVDLIVAAGGDGTLREVAEGLNGSDVPLGIIPAGTANVMARELGYMKKGVKSVKCVSKILLKNRTRPVYPFQLAHEGKSTIGLCWLGAGFDAAVLQYVSPWMKSKIGRAAFAPAMIKTMIKEPRKPSVPWQSGDTTGVAGWIILANIAKYAGPFVLTEKTAVDQQGLAWLRFKKAGAIARLVDQILLPFKPLDMRGETQELLSEQVIIGGDNTPIQLDGDLIGFGPVSVQPQAKPIMFKAGKVNSRS